MSGNFVRILFVLGFCSVLPGAAQAWDTYGQGYSGGHGSSYRPVFPTRPFFAEPGHRSERGQAYREGYRDGYGRGYGHGYGEGYRDRDIQRRHSWAQGHGYRGNTYGLGGFTRGNAYGWNSGSRARDGYQARSGYGWHRH
ncbi:MAG: hypothetical protein FJ164_01135 [Gammaproteobacteria bacterium]|nr:hypothetical protein [Gammaproteobacteria bacterium]